MFVGEEAEYIELRVQLEVTGTLVIGSIHHEEEHSRAFMSQNLR